MAAHGEAYRQLIDGALAPKVAGGVSADGLKRALARVAAAAKPVLGGEDASAKPILEITREETDIAEAEAALAALSEGAGTVVFFGTGGSGLGGETLAQLGGWNIPGFAGPEQRGRPRTRFYDNLDGATLPRALQQLNPDTTRFVITSKSGNTPETLTQAIAAIGMVRETLGAAEVGKRFLGITEPRKAGVRNGLRDLLDSIGAKILDHHTGIGGRFSVLTNVGLVPALARGLDARALRAGAQSVIERAKSAKGSAAPLEGAALKLALADEGKARVEAIMPYSDRLAAFGQWLQQLTAESLGKAGQGSTPVALLGPRDQHSVLQLLMEGPRDHLITVVRVTSPSGVAAPRLPADLCATAGVSELSGLSAGDVVKAQGHAIPEALQRAGRPVRVFELQRLDEAGLGALLMHFMLETIVLGRAMGINPFDQPGVELGKVLTRERLIKRA